jgi:hypothetical protein
MGGFLVWSIHFGLIYFVQTAFCTTGRWAGDDSSLRAIEVALTALALLALLWIAGRGLRRASDGDGGHELSPFLRTLAKASAAIALAAIVWTTLPVLMLDACGWAGA